MTTCFRVQTCSCSSSLVSSARDPTQTAASLLQQTNKSTCYLTHPNSNHQPAAIWCQHKDSVLFGEFPIVRNTRISRSHMGVCRNRVGVCNNLESAHGRPLETSALCVDLVWAVCARVYICNRIFEPNRESEKTEAPHATAFIWGYHLFDLRAWQIHKRKTHFWLIFDFGNLQIKSLDVCSVAHSAALVLWGHFNIFRNKCAVRSRRNEKTPPKFFQWWAWH